MNLTRIYYKSLFILVSLIGLFFSTHAFGEEGGMAITDPKLGDVYLSLGMPEQIVMDKLKSLQVIPVPGSNSYAVGVKTKDTSGEDLYNALAIIGFANKKLSYMNRTWYKSFNEKQTFELADKLYHLLKEGVGVSGELKTIVRVKSTRDPDKEFKSIEMITGNRRVSLVIVESPKQEWGRQVSIDESISNTPFKR